MDQTYCMKCMQPNEGTNMCPHCGYVAGETPLASYVLKPGTILDGRYLLGEPLGQGGFGITYIARDLNLDIRVAVKEYYPSGYTLRNVETSNNITITDERLRLDIQKGKGSFLKEARTLARFQGTPGIVNVLNFFEANDTAYIVMEYLEGETLGHRLKRKLFTADEIFQLMDPVFNTLEKIHMQDVVHRDISPDNIMMLPDGSLKLMDFGAARLMNYSDQRSVSIVLKAGYAPKEQYASKGKQGPWTDIYALCATIYKCITGTTPDDALDRSDSDELKWPSELGFPISMRQEAALKKGMAVLQKDRFRSIGELRAALREETGGSVESGPITIEPTQDRTERFEAAAAVLVKKEEDAAPAGEEKKEPALQQKHSNKSKRKRTGIWVACAALGLALVVLALALLPGRKKDDMATVSAQTNAPAAVPTATGSPMLSPASTLIPTDTPTITPTLSLVTLASRKTLVAGHYHLVGLKSNGTVIAVGGNPDGQCNVSSWKDIIAVSAAGYHTVGLKSDGTVVAVGYNEYGQCNVSGWTDIVAIAQENWHTVGLKSNGTVVAVGDNVQGQCNVSGWTDIVAIAAGAYHTVGLKSNGTVVAVGDNVQGQCNVSGWKDIIAISAYEFHTVGLKSDGTVVATGSNKEGECNVSDWKDIVAVATGDCHTVGLKTDGTVVAVGRNTEGECNVSAWKDIVTISAGAYHTIGLKSDGTVVTVGGDEWSQRDVSAWSDIRLPETHLTPMNKTAYSDIKVVMVTDGEDIADQSYTQATYEACKAVCQDRGLSFQCYKPTSNAGEDLIATIEAAIDDGCNAIVMNGFLFSSIIETVAEKHPGVKFIALNADCWYAAVPSNVICCFYKEELCGYMAGFAAVKLGYRKLGFLGVMAIPDVIRYGYGFVQGVDAAAAELGLSDVVVKYAYSNQYSGDAFITAYMDTWYSDDIEVVFACGGSIFTSVGESAQKFSKKIIGAEVDQAAQIDAMYGKGITVTSAMNDLTTTVNTMLGKVVDGTFEGGKIERLGIVSTVPEENYVGIASSTQFSDSFTKDDYEGLVERMFKGEITVSDDTTKNAADFATVITVDDQGNIQ